jgi:Glyoxalase-like domain
VVIPWLTVFLDFPPSSHHEEVTFWQAVTGYRLSPARGADGQFATLLPPSGDAYLRVQRVRAGGGCHLDLHLDPAEPVRDVIDRMGALGGSVLHLETGLVIADSPGGFTFCLVDWHGERAVPPPLAGGAGGATRADTLCLDVPPAEFERECAFWAAFTGQQTRPAPVPGFAFLTRPPEWPVRLLLQRRDSAAPGERTRGHLDFGCTDPDAQARHLSLGARLVAKQQYWTVLADPAGHEYCLIGREPV